MGRMKWSGGITFVALLALQIKSWLGSFGCGKRSKRASEVASRTFSGELSDGTSCALRARVVDSNSNVKLLRKLESAAAAAVV